MIRGQQKETKERWKKKKEREKENKNSPISFVTTARSSARRWVGCPFQARPEWTGCGTVGQAELQPGVPILCMAIIGEMREREREEERRKEGRKGRRKEGRKGTVINTQ